MRASFTCCRHDAELARGKAVIRMAATRERAFDVVVVGGANMDYLVKGDELPRPGATITGQLFQEAPGGKGANQAVAVARLGGRSALVASVGNDQRGEALLERLVQECVDTSAIVRHSTAPTGVALIAVDAAGEKQIVWAPGANERLTAREIAAAAGLFTNTKIALVQLEIPFDAVEAAIRLARAADVRVVLDPAPAVPLREEILRDVHVIRPNAFEARVLTGIEVEDRTSARRAAENLLRRGVRAACVGAPDGTLLVSDDGETWLPNLPVDVVDATGAGDAFAGALALALAEGSELAEAARFAHAASALATTKVGAQAALPRRDAVMALLGETRSSIATAERPEHPPP
jgi:ribokinase